MKTDEDAVSPHAGHKHLETYTLGTETCFRPNSEEVAAKVLDGEAILINLSTGTYYSLDGSGCTIWEGIEAGASEEQLVELLRGYWSVSPDLARADVARLLGELLSENLIVRAPATGSETTRLESGPLPGTKYSTPTLNIFRDMQDLLALDPPLPGLESSASAPRFDQRK